MPQNKFDFFFHHSVRYIYSDRLHLHLNISWISVNKRRFVWSGGVWKCVSYLRICQNVNLYSWILCNSMRCLLWVSERVREREKWILIWIWIIVYSSWSTKSTTFQRIDIIMKILNVIAFQKQILFSMLLYRHVHCTISLDVYIEHRQKCTWVRYLW